jgi:translocation and assembly module TamB
MRLRWIILIAALVLLVVVPVVAVYRVLNSEAGLELALAQFQRLQNIRIEATGASGTLAGPLRVERLVIEHDAVRIEAFDLRLQARMRGLLRGVVQIDQLEAARIEVVLKRREPRPPSEPHFLPRFLEVSAPDVRLGDIGLTLLDGQHVELASLQAALAMTRWRIDLTDLVADDPAGHVEGNLRLNAWQPLGLRVALNGHWRLPDERTYRFAAAARGNLGRLGTTVTLAEPANVSFIGNLLSLDEAPRAVGTVRVTDFDGSPWIEPGTWPIASGSIALDARRDAFGLDGTIVSTALGEGQLRVQGAGRWHDSTLELASLEAWLPRTGATASVAGSIRFGEPDPVLVLAGEWNSVHWPLEGDAAIRSPLGSFTLQGGLPYAFELQAVTQLPDLPDADFTAAGSIDRVELLLERFDGRLMDGRLRGSGRLAWKGEQRWSARLDGEQLDIAALRPDLPGRVTFAAAVEGSGFSPDAPWTLRLASLSGSVMGRALTGRGEVMHRAGTYELRGLRVVNGPSHAEVNGRWGPSIDLRWDADLRSLTLLHPDLAGELVTSGHARGSPERPEATGEARVRGLRYGAITATSIEAEFDVDLSDRRESHLDLQASDIDLGAIALDSAILAARGRTREHTFELRFASPGDPEQDIPGFKARVVAGGDYESAGRGWNGTLRETSIVFPDDSADLLQPAALEVGPTGIRSAPVCIASGEARLCVEGEWRADPASWRVLYSAQDWPLRRLLHSLLGWREFDGRLQASGWAAQEPGQPWTGGTALALDEPTLDIPRNQFRTDRISLGAARLDVYAEPDAIRATLAVNVADSTRLNGTLTALREPGRELLELPLRGEVRGESSAITAMPLFVPEIDRSGGELDARVSVSGTIGSPLFDGEFHVRNGRFDLYRTNLQLSNVTLDGRFVGDELVFDGRGSTARGDLQVDGRFTWPENVMTGTMRLRGENLQVADTPDFRIVASPDLVFTAGRGGFDVNGEVRIPMARITPRDLTTTVTTSSDERIVGLEVEDLGPSTLERLRSRIRVELGDNVRVNSFGLRATLEGGVTVITRPGDVARGDGAIRVKEGEYKAFGQFVRIVRGVLSYDMTPLNEPTLDLVAEREIRREDITVAINVRGTLADPFITLSSVPAMSQNEALSYLLTGRSINTLQSGEAASLDRAAESLALSGGGLLLGGIGSRVGLDEVTVEQAGEDDTAVVLGKYLSPNLFVSYGISIAEAINTIKLRYTINRNWSLKAEAGLEQSADVEYRIER